MSSLASIEPTSDGSKGWKIASSTARLLELGRRPYREVLTLQREIHAAVAAGREPETWIAVEHDPVVTLGRNAKRSNLLLSPDALANRGVDLVAVERGGDVTYHGPGQLVVYPIRKLARFREIVPLVAALERAVVAALAGAGIAAAPRSEHRGVYVAGRAIAAIGLAVKAMTSLHGLSLNADVALDYDRLITPCGTPEFGITSMARELGRPVEVSEALAILKPCLEAEFDVTFTAATASE
jgi:lipoyl(octanoyl) transferase